MKIRKALKVMGRTVQFRDIGIADAQQILELRTDPELSRHLSPTAADLSAQQEWIKRYEACADQAYFMIEHEQQPVGTVRLYDAQDDSFEWGSWIIKPGVPSHVSIESALMVYAYAVDWLGFRAAHFSVKTANMHVWQFHERFGAQRVSEGLDSIDYRIDLAHISESRQRYRRFLPGGVCVEGLQ
jgi:RimJ/RimL family protein N-acetyltransferase